MNLARTTQALGERLRLAFEPAEREPEPARIMALAEALDHVLEKGPGQRRAGGEKASD